MGEGPISDESNRLIAAWATGRKTPIETLRGLCALVETRGARAAVVATKDEKTVLVSPLEDERVTSFVTMREKLGPGRALRKKSDESFGEICTIEDASWVVCEPLPQTDGAALVVVGMGDAPLDPILIALPELALACGAICVRAALTDDVAVAAHAMNNALSSVLGNMEFAMSLLSHERGLLPRLTDESIGELFTAVRHAVRGTRTLHTRAQALLKLVR